MPTMRSCSGYARGTQISVGGSCDELGVGALDSWLLWAHHVTRCGGLQFASHAPFQLSVYSTEKFIGATKGAFLLMC